MKFKPFVWSDPFNTEEQLTHEEKKVRDSAREYAQSRLMPTVTENFRNESLDLSIVQEMGNLGFLGSSIKGYGCKGWNSVTYGLIARELERVDSGYRTIFSVLSSLAMHAIYLHGSEEQKQRYLPEMAKGKLLGCFGLTEPNHGSDPSSMETVAKKVPGGYLVNGSKKWIGLAVLADLLITWAKDDSGQVIGLLVEKGAKGLHTSYIEGKLSLRCAPTCEYTMDNVFVPDDHVLPHAKGLSAPFACMNLARYAISWGTLGAAESCWHIAREYTLNRQQFGQPLAAKQLIQYKLADMQTEIALALQGCLQVGRLLDQEKASHEMISLIKRNSSRKALTIARTAREILGANGILDDFHVMRHMVNLESIITYEGSSDIHALLLGRAQTGVSSF